MGVCKLFICSKIIGMCFLFWLIAGCMPQQKAIQGERFKSSAAPSQGKARIYIFRPAFESVRRSEVPQLYLDGALLASLKWASYVDVELEPGQHQVQLSINRKKSLWNANFSVQPQADTIYYLAIWDKNKVTKSYGRSILSALPSVALGGPVFFMMSPYGTISNELGVELLEKNVAETELFDCVKATEN